MTIIPSLSETFIRQKVSVDVYSRGQRYEQERAVADLTLRGNRLEASVHGSQYEPYHVHVTFDAGGITEASCTCPYAGGGWCKHIIATLLTVLHRPDTVSTHQPLEQILEPLSREQLQMLVLRIVAQHPDLNDAIEHQIALMQPAMPPAPTDTGTPAQRPPVDVAPVRRRVRTLLIPSRHSYDYGYSSDVLSSMREISEQVQGFIKGGDGKNALRLLEAITDEYVDQWYQIDDSNGELGGFFDDLGELWAEALLSSDLSADELEDWSDQISSWAASAAEYGVDEGLNLAKTAALQGWHHPDIVRALRGEQPSQSSPEMPATAQAYDEEEEWDDEQVEPASSIRVIPSSDIHSTWLSPAQRLALIRLRILERQGRYDEYLNFAAAAGEVALQAVMLAKLGRVHEAVEIGLRRLQKADDALALATVLRERGELEAALQIADHGLNLAEPRAALGNWLAGLAQSLGRHDLALHAARTAFDSSPSLAGYQMLHEFSGDSWSELRTTLLDQLRQRRSVWNVASAAVDIFLQEGLVEDAIAVVDSGSGYGNLERVMDAAIPVQPNWVIKRAIGQAETIINAGRAQHYDRAVEWLRRARDAYRASGRSADWRSYLATLRAEHGRKYKLMGLIERL